MTPEVLFCQTGLWEQGDSPAAPDTRGCFELA